MSDQCWHQIVTGDTSYVTCHGEAGHRGPHFITSVVVITAFRGKAGEGESE